MIIVKSDVLLYAIVSDSHLSLRIRRIDGFFEILISFGFWQVDRFLWLLKLLWVKQCHLLFVHNFLHTISVILVILNFIMICLKCKLTSSITRRCTFHWVTSYFKIICSISSCLITLLSIALQLYLSCDNNEKILSVITRRITFFSIGYSLMSIYCHQT